MFGDGQKQQTHKRKSVSPKARQRMQEQIARIEPRENLQPLSDAELAAAASTVASSVAVKKGEYIPSKRPDDQEPIPRIENPEEEILSHTEAQKAPKPNREDVSAKRKRRKLKIPRINQETDATQQLPIITPSATSSPKGEDSAQVEPVNQHAPDQDSVAASQEVQLEEGLDKALLERPSPQAYPEDASEQASVAPSLQESAGTQAAPDASDETTPTFVAVGQKFKEKQELAAQAFSRARAQSINKCFVRRLVVGVSVSTLILVLILSAVYSWNRWLRFDDIKDIQGIWKIESSDKSITFNDGTIELNKDTHFNYHLDTFTKTIYFSFGELSGSGLYQFSQDRKTLVISEAVKPSILTTLGFINLDQAHTQGESKTESPLGDISHLIRQGSISPELPKADTNEHPSGGDTVHKPASSDAEHKDAGVAKPIPLEPSEMGEGGTVVSLEDDIKKGLVPANPQDAQEAPSSSTQNQGESPDPEDQDED